ncbi:hypothetical protein ACVDG3_06245 [Meridianimarinicoccus sp. RP-17]|uniref:hypothetical protein n=1 Tax=Meridianimarinicoccus zhengii TaxID=2056810 RepID=UPI001C9B4476|nr:hypothetical protein [Phycocomes zhengii]
MPATKIATCCYCGTRAALVLRGDIRHELSCAACGAPLHDLKAMPVDRARTAKPAAARPAPRGPEPARHAKPRRRKRKSLSRRILSEAFDLIEDILD